MRASLNRAALIGICILIFLSCKKDREVADYNGDYEINGRVLDEITGKPVPYALVGVLQKERGLTSYLGTQSAATAKADEAGKFNLKFYVNAKENNYELTAQALTYFEKSSGGDDISFTKNGKKTQDVRLMPYGYLTFHIIGNKGGQRMNLSVSGGGSEFYSGVDSFRTYPALPGKIRSFVYGAFDANNVLIYKKDTSVLIHLPPDTTYFLIEF